MDDDLGVPHLWKPPYFWYVFEATIGRECLAVCFGPPRFGKRSRTTSGNIRWLARENNAAMVRMGDGFYVGEDAAEWNPVIRGKYQGTLLCSVPEVVWSILSLLVGSVQFFSGGIQVEFFMGGLHFYQWFLYKHDKGPPLEWGLPWRDFPKGSPLRSPQKARHRGGLGRHLSRSPCGFSLCLRDGEVHAEGDGWLHQHHGVFRRAFHSHGLFQ